MESDKKHKDLWKHFAELCVQGYEKIYTNEPAYTVWNKAFAEFTDVLHLLDSEGGRPATLEELEEQAESDGEFLAWFDDYLTELDIAEDYTRLAHVVEWLKSAFSWPQEDPLQLRYLGIRCMFMTGEGEEALKQILAWRKEAPDEQMPVIAQIRCLTVMGRLEEAKALAEEYIQEDTECTEDNELLFCAAMDLGEALHNRRWQRLLEQRYQEYLDSFADDWESEEDLEEEYE